MVDTVRRARHGDDDLDARPEGPHAARRSARPQPLPLSRFSLVLLAILLLVTAALSWATYRVNERNENRLLALQTKQAATVLQAIIPALQTPLASAAEIAATSNGSAARFTGYIESYVATAGRKGTFVAASLWRMDEPTPHLITTVGQPPALVAHPAQERKFLRGAAKAPAFDVIGPIGTANPRLGFAYASAGRPTYVVYAESALPRGRRALSQPDSAFAELRFAMYLGRSPRPAALIEANTDQVPVTGHTAQATVSFGTGVITLVAARAGQLGGTLAQMLWWIVALIGMALAVTSAVVAERLQRRRRAAERLTGEVRSLLSEQRGIAETLQHALLPQQIPDVAGLDIAARYIPGVDGIDIGGDWYDLIELDENRVFFVVGDVSGRGVASGSVMASLLFAIRGFVSEGYGPAAVLDRLSALLDVGRDQHFATVVCGVADIERHEIALANAGHLPPLLLGEGREFAGEFVRVPTGPPIGVRKSEPYAAVTVSVPARATLLAYTDGLVERRGETLDVGLRHLHTAALRSSGRLDDALSTIVAELALSGLGCFDDDTAILGVQWRS
jgi:serine phosphatase RsbU (regulator of sigma subunit)